MKHLEFNWNTSGNVEIYGQAWECNAPKAVLCLVHGMGEHSGRYRHVAEYFNTLGYTVIAYDHRGHGKSGGKRGHCPTYELLLEGVKELFQQAGERYGNLPQFLYGHSMGGNVVLNFALRKKPRINGVISSGPWLKLAFEPPAIQVKLGKLVSGIFPSFTQRTKLDANLVSRDKQEVKAYQDDPLVHDYISSSMFLGCYDAGIWALENADKMEIPLLIFHGTDDQLTSHKASEEFAGKAKGDITLKLWDGLFHECHNEPENAEVLTFIGDWMERRLANKPLPNV